LTCVQSSATYVMGSTPNIQIMLIQGRPSPSEPMKHSPVSEKNMLQKV